jgi:hypothetical protein
MVRLYHLALWHEDVLLFEDRFCAISMRGALRSANFRICNFPGLPDVTFANVVDTSDNLKQSCRYMSGGKFISRWTPVEKGEFSDVSNSIFGPGAD